MSTRNLNGGALTFRVPPDLRRAFAKRCDDAALGESHIARLLMGGFVAGTIDIIATGAVHDTKSDPRQTTLPGMPAPAKHKTKARSPKKSPKSPTKAKKGARK